MNSKNISVIVVIALLLIITFFVGFYSNDSSEESNLFRTLLRADFDLSKISIESQEANRYYEESKIAYENEDYKFAESNCRLARDKYSNIIQGYEGASAKLKASEIEDELIFLYIESLESLIESKYNIFESCEHFESALRYYDKYYNTNVPYDDPSYDMGTREIEMMNEKIKGHDEAVKKYNRLLEEFKIELEGRINNKQ